MHAGKLEVARAEARENTDCVCERNGYKTLGASLDGVHARCHLLGAWVLGEKLRERLLRGALLVVCLQCCCGSSGGRRWRSAVCEAVCSDQASYIVELLGREVGREGPASAGRSHLVARRRGATQEEEKARAPWSPSVVHGEVYLASRIYPKGQSIGQQHASNICHFASRVAAGPAFSPPARNRTFAWISTSAPRTSAGEGGEQLNRRRIVRHAPRLCRVLATCPRTPLAARRTRRAAIGSGSPSPCRSQPQTRRGRRGRPGRARGRRRGAPACQT